MIANEGDARDYDGFSEEARVKDLSLDPVAFPDAAPRFVQYVNTRDFSGDPQAGTAGDLAPEGVLFIPRGASPIRKPLLVVTYEVSGTTTIFSLEK